jgi:Conserved TM helix
MNTTIHWLTTAFDGLVAFLPNLVAGLVILLVGWVIAVVLARVTRMLARRLGFDRLFAKLGISNNAAPSYGSQMLGSIVYAIVMVVAVMQAPRVWRLDFIANGLAAVIGYLPHVLAAAVVFGVSLYIGNWVRDRLYRARPAQTETEVAPAGGGTTTAPRFLPGLIRGVILAIGAFMALRELQIAPEIVNAAFMLTLGALAVAGAVAFGLGGRDVAGRIAQSWWDRRGTYGPAITPPSTPGGMGRVEVSA